MIFNHEQERSKGIQLFKVTIQIPRLHIIGHYSLVLLILYNVKAI